jgi:lambda repressor-like predicted transcriptional regulator
MDIRLKIKVACEISGVSITEISKQMGISQPTFSQRLKVGKFRQEELEEIAGMLGCEYHSFFVFPDGSKIGDSGEKSAKQKIKAAFDLAGITMTELGKYLGVSQPAISKRLKNGKFTQEELENIAKMIGCEYHSFLVFPDGKKIE